MGWQVVYVPFLFAGDTIINQNGVFVYNGSPAHGNLKASIAGSSGTDPYGNAYIDNIVAYNVSGVGTGGFAQIAANPSTGLPFLVLAPPSLTHVSANPQVNAGSINAGAVNEQAQINVTSGFESTPGSGGAAVLQLVSRANDSTLVSLAKLSADDIEFSTGGNTVDATVNATDGSFQYIDNLAGDGNTYKAGHFATRMATNQQITSTTPVVITSMAWPVAVGPAYHLTIMAVVSPDQAAGGAAFGWDGTAVTSNANGHGTWKQNAAADNMMIWDGSLAGTAGSHAFALGTEQVFVSEIWFTVSTAGTLNLRAQESTAGDSFHIKSCIGRMEII